MESQGYIVNTQIVPWLRVIKYSETNQIDLIAGMWKKEQVTKENLKI